MQELTVSSILPQLSLSDIKDIMGEEGGLISKISEKFTDKQQQIFISAFLFHTKDKSKGFVVDFDDAWKYAGYSRKDHAKVCLLNPKKGLKEGVDYILNNTSEISGVLGEAPGNPNEKIFLTVRGFKLFCMAAGTSRAIEFHIYYVTLEECVIEVIEEHFTKMIEERDKMLQVKTKQLEDTKTAYSREKIAKSKRDSQLLINKHTKDRVHYIIDVGYDPITRKRKYKNGYAKSIERRFKEHQDTYGEDIFIVHIVSSVFYISIETDFIKMCKDEGLDITNTIDGVVHREHFSPSETFTIDDAIIFSNSLKRRYETYENMERECARLQDKIEAYEAATAAGTPMVVLNKPSLYVSSIQTIAESGPIAKIGTLFKRSENGLDRISCDDAVEICRKNDIILSTVKIMAEFVRLGYMRIYQNRDGERTWVFVNIKENVPEVTTFPEIIPINGVLTEEQKFYNNLTRMFHIATNVRMYNEEIITLCEQNGVIANRTVLFPTLEKMGFVKFKANGLHGFVNIAFNKKYIPEIEEYTEEKFIVRRGLSYRVRIRATGINYVKTFAFRKDAIADRDRALAEYEAQKLAAASEDVPVVDVL